MARRVIGVLGASSLVGGCLLAPQSTSCLDADLEFVAFSRSPMIPGVNPSHRVSRRCLEDEALHETVQPIEYWICLAPIWILPDYYPLLENCGARRVVALSSTSRYTKMHSSDADERRVVASLISGEKQLINWAEKRGIAWIILRPTLIYGLGRDKNISSIADFIRRFGFFPLLGAARGLRQPIHACDVATACLQALLHTELANQAYNISGGETLAYDEMVRRVFDAMGKNSRLLHIPHLFFRLMLALSKLVPNFRGVSTEMMKRMNQDLIFDHSDAGRDFCFKARPFRLDEDDFS